MAQALRKLGTSKRGGSEPQLRVVPLSRWLPAVAHPGSEVLGSEAWGMESREGTSPYSRQMPGICRKAVAHPGGEAASSAGSSQGSRPQCQTPMPPTSHVPPHLSGHTSAGATADDAGSRKSAVADGGHGSSSGGEGDGPGSSSSRGGGVEPGMGGRGSGGRGEGDGPGRSSRGGGEGRVEAGDEPTAEDAYWLAELQRLLPGVERAGLGWQALPDATGYGPLFWCVLERTA